jgi:hypothetical protein
MGMVTDKCEGLLTYTQAYLRMNMVNEDRVMGRFAHYGWLCDCEIIMNAPRHIPRGEPLPLL